MSTKRQPPKLPASAFVSKPPPPRRTKPAALIDTHIHLWTPAQLASGNKSFAGEDPSILHQPHVAGFYGEVTGLAQSLGLLPPLEGFVFVQAEVSSGAATEVGEWS